MSPQQDHHDGLPGRRAAERRRAVAVAGHTGDVDVARRGASDPDARVRAGAVAALERLDRLDTATLAAALVDPDPGVRRRAALAAAHRSDLSAELAILLEDPDPTVVETAAFACGERTDAGDELVGRLAELAVGHRDHLCREAAVAALGSLGHPAGLEAVLHGCTDRHTVRRRAVLALAAFDGPRVTEALRRLSGDRDLQVRQAAEELLAIEEGAPLGRPDDSGKGVDRA